MKKKKIESLIPDEVIINKIYFIRGQKVMLDRDLAEMYSVETKQIKRQVRRNIDIFPEHFMFKLNPTEFANWRSQIGTSNFSDKMGLRYPPFAFTQHGILQLANVLKSKSARKMSVRIIEVFFKMQEMLMTHKDILLKLEQLERKTDSHDGKIKLIFEYIKKLLQPPIEPRKKIGYRIQGK